jgi:hypothetical protein
MCGSSNSSHRPGPLTQDGPCPPGSWPRAGGHQDGPHLGQAGGHAHPAWSNVVLSGRTHDRPSQAATEARQAHGPGPRWVRTASGTARRRLVRPGPVRHTRAAGPDASTVWTSADKPAWGWVQVPSDTPPELQLLPSPNLLVLADPADRRVRVKPRTTAIPRVDAIRRHLGWLTRLAASRSPHLDACIMLGNKPWDTSAGVLVAREAGARVLDHDGTEHSQQSHSTNRSHTSAGNRSHGGSTGGVS